MTAPRTPRRRRVPWRRLVAAGTGLLLLTTVCIVASATCRPSWYRPTGIDYATLPLDKRDLFDLLDAIGAALNGGQPLDFVLGQEQLNRWLAARAEFWPERQIEIEGLSLPQVSLLDGNRVRLAGTFTRGGITVVLSATARLELTPETLRIHLESLRLGRLPVPRDQVTNLLREILGSENDASVSVSDDTVALSNRWVWPNGKRRCQLSHLEISNGTARIALAPAGSAP